VEEGETRLAAAAPEVPEPEVERPAEVPEERVLALAGLEDPEPGAPAEAAPVPAVAAKRDPRASGARTRVARQGAPRPATTAAAPAGGTPPQSATREVTAAEAPASAQTAAPQTGGSADDWYDDVVRNNLGVTPPEGRDPYDWLISTFVTVQVFGVTSGPVMPRFATKLQRASARAEEMVRERFAAQGQPVTGPLTTANWNIRSVSGWDARRTRGSHAFGQATDIDYWSNPYVAHEAGAAEQTVDQQTAAAYDRAVMLFGDGTRLLSVVPSGAIGSGPDRIDRPARITNVTRPGGTGAAGRTALFNQTLTVYNQLASDSAAMQQYFALVYPPPDLTSMTPTAATPHAIDAADVRALLPRLQALPAVALQRVFEGAPPTTLDEASVGAALRPIVERDYERLGGTATNAGTAGDRPFATGGTAAQRAQRDPRRGFMTLPFEVVYALRAEGLRWGACDLGGASGDIQHFDDAIAHPIPQRT
jgi:hypothetical protein